MADDDVFDDRGSRLGLLGLLLPALTFVVGLGLGGALIYATAGGSGGGVLPGGTTPEASASASAEAAGDTVVTVPAACQDAAEKVTEAYGLIREAVDQVRNFQANELVATLNDLEEVDGETRPLADECSAVSVDVSPTPSGSASPSTDPSASDSAEPSDSAQPSEPAQPSESPTS